jgi:hypothetical protein
MAKISDNCQQKQNVKVNVCIDSVCAYISFSQNRLPPPFLTEIHFALPAWSSGIVSARLRGDREIESGQGIGWQLFKNGMNSFSTLWQHWLPFQLDHCADNWQASCLRTVRPNLHSDIVRNVRRLSFTSMSAGSDDGSAPDPDNVASGRHHHFAQESILWNPVSAEMFMDTN